MAIVLFLNLTFSALVCGLLLALVVRLLFRLNDAEDADGGGGDWRKRRPPPTTPWPPRPSGTGSSPTHPARDRSLRPIRAPPRTQALTPFGNAPTVSAAVSTRHKRGRD